MRHDFAVGQGYEEGRKGSMGRNTVASFSRKFDCLTGNLRYKENAAKTFVSVANELPAPYIAQRPDRKRRYLV